MLFDVPSVERRGEQDARVALAIVEVDGDDEFFATQALRFGEMRAAAIRQRVAGFAAGAPAADAIGIGKGEQQARIGIVPRVLAASSELPRKVIAPCAARAATRPGPCLGGDRLAVDQLDAAADVAIPGAAQEIALRQQRGKLAAQRRRCPAPAPSAACARVAGERRAVPSRVRAAVIKPLCIERAEARQQIARARQHGGGRRVEPPQGCSHRARPSWRDREPAAQGRQSTISGGVNAARLACAPSLQAR